MSKRLPPKRRGLDALPFATKPGASVSSEVVELPAASAEAKGKSDERKTIILRVSAEDRRELKMISVRDGRTIQDMLHDAVQDIIRRSN